MSESLLFEYKILRSEIDQKIKLHNTLLTFTITTVVAVLSFVFLQDEINPFLFLLPFGIIIPMSMRVTYYRSTIIKLSSYIIVYLEKELNDINWETRNMKLISNRNYNKNCFKKLAVLRDYEFIILSVLCYIMYFIFYVFYNEFSFIMLLNVIWPLIFLFIEGVITSRINSIDRERKVWINRWKKLQSYESKHTNE